eukprot:6972241-Pyramimonas_sp.AAC.1
MGGPAARMDVRARCAPRPIHATYFAPSATRQAMLRGISGDFVLIFNSQDGRARIDGSAPCAPRPICAPRPTVATYFAPSTTRQAMLR